MPRSPSPSRPRSSVLSSLGLRWPASLGMPLSLLLLACTGKAAVQDPAPVPPTAATTTPASEADELAVRLAVMSERLEAARISHHIPGMAVAVVKDDEIIFAEGFGLADVATKRKATPETLFAVGSTTKAFTSALVAMMIDEGKLGWDDPVNKYVSEFQIKPRAKEASAAPESPTLRDVLCHRSGFTRMGLLWASGELSDKEVYAKASGAEPVADFRKKFLYNNVTYASAGEAAARAAGTTWAQMLQDRIFGPLGMSRTNVTTEAAMADPQRSTGYRWREVSETAEAVPMRSLDAVAPAGAINSTVLDMAQWIRLQLGRGEYEGTRLVSADRLADTWSSQIKVGGDIQYGMGWMLGRWQDHRVVEHGGNIDGYSAEVAMLPDDQIGFVLLTNVSVTPLQRESMGIVFESLLGELPSDDKDKSGPDLDLRPYLGKYVANFGPFSDERFAVTDKDGALFVDVPGQTNYELRPPNDEGHWVFAMTDTIKVSFDQDDKGRAQVMHMHQGGFDFELPREGYTVPADFTREEVADKLGRYRSENGKLKAQLRLEDGRLVADVKGQMAFVLHKPDDKGRWRFRARKEIALSFREGKDGVDALTIHQGGTDTLLTRIATREDPLPTVAQLIKKSKADAVAKRLAKLGVVELTGTVRMPSSAVEGKVQMWFDAEHRYRVVMDFGRHGRSIETYDGTAAWTVSNLGPATQHEGKYLHQASLGMSFLLGDWLRRFETASVEGREGEGKDERLVVTLRTKDLPPATAHVDPRNGQVVAIRQIQLNEGAGPIPVKIELGDYRKAQGLRLPHRVESKNEHSGSTIFEIKSVKKSKADPATVFARGTL